MTRADRWRDRVLALAAGAAMAAAGLMAADAMGRRGGESPDEAIARDALPHRCAEPDCAWCAERRRWAEAHPGRYPGDIADAADLGLEATPARPAAEGAP